MIFIGATGRHSHHTSTLDPYLLHQRRSSKMKFPSSMSLDETDSSDDSTYSSQYQSDANSTPRTGTSHTLPRNLPTRSSNGVTSVVALASSNNSVLKVGKSMSDYEAEILQMRAEMEQLQCKLSEAERQLSQENSNQRTEQSSAQVSSRLMREEDKLRRELCSDTNMDAMSEKEKMIAMQQKKIAALDAANRRLLDELNRISNTNKVSVTTSPINVTSINTSSNTVSTAAAAPPGEHNRRISSSSSSSNKSITVITNGEATVKVAAVSPNGSSASSQETPKTVDELLDSLHSTSI